MKTQVDGSTQMLLKQPSGLGETGLRVPWLLFGLTLVTLLVMTFPGSAAESPSGPAQTVAVPPSDVQAVDSLAKPAAAPEADPFATSVPPPPAPAKLRDPTQPSEHLKAILGQQRAVKTSAPTAKLPALRIKGRVASPDGDVLVLLQIGQQMERVTADTEWTTEDGLTITVLSVSLSELRLQIQPHNRTVTIR
ncbi:MAG: hypothetical protein MUF25_27005 [Pirellulaceae bacterium]|nr:hypothetical protein [Pirellulaceae bacterium]